MINWGIIGYGRMGKIFAQSFKKVKENCNLVGISSKSNFNNQSNFFKNYDELINSSKINAIYISTLNNTHKDLVIKSIKKNKKILCEKPLGLNLIEVKEIYDLLKDKKNILFEAIAYRAHPQTLKLLEILNEKNFGKIKKIEANFGFRIKKIKKDSRLFKKSLGGGSILDLGCYPISFFNLFLNDFKSYEILKSNYDICETNVDIDAEIRLKLNGEIDAVGKVSLSQNLDNKCIIHCENATITIPSPWLPSEKTFLEIKTKNRYFKEFISSDKNAYQHQLEKVSSSFTNESVNFSHLVDIEESLEISRILDAWRN